MRWMVLLLLVVGCGSKKAEPLAPELAATSPAPAAVNCAHPRGYAFAIQFVGFPEYSEEQHLFIYGAPGVFASAEREIVHPELRGAYAFGSWSPGTTCTNSFMYLDPYSATGGMLFPPGSKYEKFQLTWDLLCADIKCSANPYFFDIRNLVWAGVTLPVHDQNGDVIPNQSYTYNNHGKGGGPAQLYVAEIENMLEGDLVRGVRMELPGKKTVLISVTAQGCP